MVKGLIGALIGGVIGAAIWAAVGYFTGYEVGWIAWGVGALAGFGMAVGAKDDSSAVTGAIAAAVAIGSILAGKYAVAHFIVDREITKIAAEMGPVTMEDAKIHMADQLVHEYEGAGKPLAWPEGMTYEDAEQPDHYPKDLWKDLETRWASMEPAKQEEYRVSVQAQSDTNFQLFRAEATSGAFKDSFSAWDGLWFVFALISAFKIGSGGGSDSE